MGKFPRLFCHDFALFLIQIKRLRDILEGKEKKRNLSKRPRISCLTFSQVHSRFESTVH
jgi:hypothetical protein